MKKRWAIPLVLSALALFAWTGTLTIRQQQTLAGQLVRLHVVARSDEREDQENKLRVRDRVLSCAQTYLDGAQDAGAAAAALSGHLGELESAARECLAELGAPEDVTVTLGREALDTRVYDTFSLPAGQYMTLRVVIGAGEGHNWWCVVFPSLCTAATADELEQTALTSGLTEGQLTWITSDDADVRLRFRLLEWLQMLFG